MQGQSFVLHTCNGIFINDHKCFAFIIAYISGKCKSY